MNDYDNLQDHDGDLREDQLWAGDKGALSLAARKALLRLVRGPMLTTADAEAWKALTDNRQLIESRLADLFLCLVLDEVTGIAFVRNATSEEVALPKAVRSQTLSLMDTIVVLMLRNLLLIGQEKRVIVGKEELYAQVASFRPVTSMDQAKFRSAYDSSWKHMKELNILVPTNSEDRFEVSPVLRLIFGPEEVRDVMGAFQKILAEENADAGTLFESMEEGARTDEY